MNIKNITYTILKGYKKAKSLKNKGGRSSFSVYREMVSLCLKYNLYLSDYVGNGFHAFNDEERKVAIDLLKEKREYIKKRDENWRFLIKYSDFKYQRSNKAKEKKRLAYIKQYHMGPHCKVQYGVMFIFDHRNIGKLNIGDNVLFARNVDVDITGDLTISDGVKISEGAKILTHSHDFLGTYREEDLIPFSNRAHNTPLFIGENVLIGAHSIIMPNVKTIGENAVISAGSVVAHPVPANTIVSGNPAVVVGKMPKRLRVSTQQFYDDSFAAQIRKRMKS
jgi:acetyltransferase-like isoleucine patch superfamily enzyme